LMEITWVGPDCFGGMAITTFSPGKGGA
jgi:hypothetical protein